MSSRSLLAAAPGSSAAQHLCCGASGRASQTQGHVQGSRRYGTEESAPIDWIVPPRDGMVTQPSLSEMFAYHATTMANTMYTSLIVFSRQVCHSSARQTAATMASLPAMLWCTASSGSDPECCQDDGWHCTLVFSARGWNQMCASSAHVPSTLEEYKMHPYLHAQCMPSHCQSSCCCFTGAEPIVT